MQTPKDRTPLKLPQQKSTATPPAARRLKTHGSDTDSVPSPNSANMTPKNRSPKVSERRSPQSSLSEKKRLARVTELESQLSQLQDDLKKAKDQLNMSESLKRRAQQEAEDGKKQLLAMTAKLEDSHHQLLELYASDDERVQELRKISHDRDRAWQSELEALEKQHSFDSAALASAMKEIQKFQGLKMELDETRSLIENLRSEVVDCKEFETRLREYISETHKQLKITNAKELPSDGIKTMEFSCSSFPMELVQSQAQVKSSEKSCSDSDSENLNCNSGLHQKSKEHEEAEQLKAEVKSLMEEVGLLKSAFETAEITTSHEEYVHSDLLNAQHMKLQSFPNDSESDARLEELNWKKTDMLNISEEDEGSNSKIGKDGKSQSESELTIELKKLADDVMELRESRRSMLAKEESRLDAARAANNELEAEIRRLKVQSDQWRKAAEAAAAMLSTADGTISLDSNYNTIGTGLGSSFWEDMNDDSPKKKNGNMLKKIGVLWKKGQK